MFHSSRRAPLVGRRAESAALVARWEAVTRGQAEVVFVSGEPGIGKTRLLDDVAAWTAAAGATVLRGGASDAAGMPPYLPFLEALGRYVRSTAPDRLRALVGEAAATLATLLPELGHRLGDPPPAYPLPAEQARLRLYEAVADLLAALARDTPVVLILDDVHWADAASLDLLCHVARAEPEARLLVLGAYRRGETAANPAFDRTLDELNRLRVLTQLTLSALSEGEVMTLAATWLDAAVDPTVGRTLHAHSEGNPFFAEELLRGWIEAEVLVRTDGRWLLRSDAPIVAELRLPPSIAGAIRRRLGRLAPVVVSQLRTAAIIGRTFAVAVLAEVDEQDADIVEQHLQAAARAGLIQPGADGEYRFSHDRIRECLAAELTSVRRARAHGAVGRALEARTDSADAQRLAELAFHFARSGDRRRGARYSQEAAERALTAYAAEDALRHYRTTLDLLDPSDDRRGVLLMALGEAALLATAERDAAVAFEAAQAWFSAAGDTAAAAQAAHGAGKAWWRLEEIAAARRAFETALTLLDRQPSGTLVHVLVDLADLLAVSLGQLHEATDLARQALQLARTLDDRVIEAAASRATGNLLVRINQLAAGVTLLEQARDLAKAAGDPVEAAECCAYLAMSYAWQGNLVGASQATRERLGFAQQTRDPFQLRHIHGLLITEQSYRGDWAAADHLYDEGLQVVTRLASPEPLAFLRFAAGASALFRGDHATAEALLTQAISAFRELGPGALVWYLGALGLVYAVDGRPDAATACMDELEALVALQPHGSMQTAEPLSYLTQMALTLSDRERVARCYPRLVAFTGQCHDFAIDRLVGEAELLCGKPGAAQHLAAAARLAEQAEMPHELARCLEAQARCVTVDGGTAAQARPLLKRALDLFEQLSMHASVSRVRATLGRVSRRAPVVTATDARSLPAGLSPREAEVLRLVATGRSNRAIAVALEISERTVANHLTSILTKTASDNRAAAAAYAIRHRLL